MNTLIIIRTDAIGDYLLFRSIFKEIKTQCPSLSITLVGNAAWRELAEKLDNEYVDTFIWVKINRYTKSRVYRFWKNLQLSKSTFDMCICAVRSRRKYYEDEFVQHIRARVKVGNGEVEPNVANGMYTRLIQVHDRFEFNWNLNFIAKALDLKVNTQLSTKQNHPKEQLGQYVLLFIGASEKHKIWNPINFARIATYLKENYNEKTMLIGSTNESENAGIIVKFCNTDTVINNVGKTSLIDVLEIFKKSKLVISNDSMGGHLAASLGIPTICIYKGDYYGRFLPYPKNITRSLITVMPPSLLMLTEEMRLEKYAIGVSEIDIEEIKWETVIGVVETMLKNDN